MILDKFMLLIKANPKIRQIDTSDKLFTDAKRLRYKIYCVEQGFLDKNEYPSHEESDEYDEHAIHVVVTVHNKIAGYCRIILPNSKGLPIFHHFELGQDENPSHSCEVSRFMIAKEFRSDKLVRREVFRLLAQEVLRVVDKQKVVSVFAVVEDWLLKSLKNRGYDFEPIGDGKFFMGAVTYPTKLQVVK